MQRNKIELCGNLTHDPELSYTKDQKPVCRIGLAVNEGYGEHKRTLFIECTEFGHQAEDLNKFFHKGKAIFIDGNLRLEKWTDKQGQKHSSYRVRIYHWDFWGPADKPVDTPKPEPKQADIPF